MKDKQQTVELVQQLLNLWINNPTDNADQDDKLLKLAAEYLNEATAYTLSTKVDGEKTYKFEYSFSPRYFDIPSIDSYKVTCKDRGVHNW